VDKETKNVARYIKEKGFNLTALSKNTGIPYNALRDSLSGGARSRSLRAGEFIEICKFLGKNPMYFSEP